MKILGISSHYHDASAALVVNGRVVASAAEERFTREKHDPSFPLNAIKFCLQQSNLDFEDIDYVAYHEDPFSKFSRNLAASLVRWPFSVGTFINSMKEAVVSGLWVKNQISRELNIHPKRIVYIPHHLGHAAHSFLSSPFEKAAILSVDAAGEWTSTGIFWGDKESKTSFISPLKTVAFPASIGLVYSAFTGFLGFKVNSSESSTMALAAFGKPVYADLIRQIIRIDQDKLFEIDLDYFDFSKLDSLPLTDKFLKAFGAPRSYKSRLGFDCFQSEQIIPSEDDLRYANIAASIQLVTEEVVLHLAKIAKEITGASHLCISGGVALNCVSNGNLLRASGFESIYCPPDPGDGGGAMGAALYLSAEKFGISAKSKLTPFLGADIQMEGIREMLSCLDSSQWRKYSMLPLEVGNKSNFKFKEFETEDELINTVSDLILDNKIVGWVQGRFENGPRALGARSILINPGNTELAKRLSKSVKLRAPYRPYACSFIPQSAIEFLDLDGTDVPLLARWMLCAVSVKSEKRSLIKAAIHIDGTTRPQIVEEDENKIYYNLIKKLGEKSGVAAVLNTSFNESEHPIVNTPTEALLTFARTSMDALVIGNILIERKS